MKIMSFNLRYDTDGDKAHAFRHRKQGIVALIQEEKPMLIGFQEAQPHMEDYLSEQLPDYKRVGLRRDEGGEANPIYFHRSLNLMDHQTRWYGDQPLTPGSKHKDADFPRIYTIAEFKHFVMVNTHLSHMSETARVDAIKQLSEYLKNHYADKCLFISGDFNQTPSEDFLAPLKKPLKLKSCWDYYNQPLIKTFHGYETVQEGEPIDYIFVCDPIRIREATIHTKKYNDRFVSDHHPISVVIE